MSIAEVNRGDRADNRLQCQITPQAPTHRARYAAGVRHSRCDLRRCTAQPSKASPARLEIQVCDSEIGAAREMPPLNSTTSRCLS
jgi:hypothetical protein